MEYDLALRVGVPSDKIIVNGPYKNKPALEKFLLSGSIVNLDSYKELENLILIASENKDKELKVCIRCNFEIDNNLISRFGFDVEHSSFNSIFNNINRVNNIKLKGLHCHFPNRDLESFNSRVDKMLLLIDEFFEIVPEFINIGGGYFGKMNIELSKQFNIPVPSYNQYGELIAKKVNAHFINLSEAQKPKLFLEPGSALVANSMNFICKVIDVKEIRNKRIAMTTGSKFNMGLLTSKLSMPMKVYSSNINNQFLEDKLTDISGYTCIESDYLYKNFKGSIEIDDFLLFENVGSYSVVFKPPFILPNVPIIEINKVGYSEIKRQETMEDIFSTFKFKNE